MLVLRSPPDPRAGALRDAVVEHVAQQEHRAWSGFNASGGRSRGRLEHSSGPLSLSPLARSTEGGSFSPVSSGGHPGTAVPAPGVGGAGRDRGSGDPTSQDARQAGVARRRSTGGRTSLYQSSASAALPSSVASPHGSAVLFAASRSSTALCRPLSRGGAWASVRRAPCGARHWRGWPSASAFLSDPVSHHSEPAHAGTVVPGDQLAAACGFERALSNIMLGHIAAQGHLPQPG